MRYIIYNVTRSEFRLAKLIPRLKKFPVQLDSGTAWIHLEDGDLDKGQKAALGAGFRIATFSYFREAYELANLLRVKYPTSKFIVPGASPKILKWALLRLNCNVVSVDVSGVEPYRVSVLTAASKLDKGDKVIKDVGQSFHFKLVAPQPQFVEYLKRKVLKDPQRLFDTIVILDFNDSGSGLYALKRDTESLFKDFGLRVSYNGGMIVPEVIAVSIADSPEPSVNNPTEKDVIRKQMRDLYFKSIDDSISQGHKADFKNFGDAMQLGHLKASIGRNAEKRGYSNPEHWQSPKVLTAGKAQENYQYNKKLYQSAFQLEIPKELYQYIIDATFVGEGRQIND
jgi:hypothetical protein